MKNTKTFTAREVMVPFKCDVHGWMTRTSASSTHPFFAVTPDGGTFELKNLPAGTYTVEAWHEKFGTQTQTVTVGEKDAKSHFTFKRTRRIDAGPTGTRRPETSRPTCPGSTATRCSSSPRPCC